MYPQRREKCRQGIHLANISPRRASFPVWSTQIMHNGQTLPLICDSAFCAEGGGGARPALWFWGIGALRPPSRGSASVVNLNRRCEHRGAHPETQAHGRVLPVGKPCINPQARAPWGPPGGANIMGPNRRCKRCGRPSWGANVVARSLCGNARAATKVTGRGRPLRTRRRLRGR